MLLCIGKVLSRKDKLVSSRCIHTGNFNKERNKFNIPYIVIIYSLNNVIY